MLGIDASSLRVYNWRYKVRGKDMKMMGDVRTDHMITSGTRWRLIWEGSRKWPARGWILLGKGSNSTCFHVSELMGTTAACTKKVISSRFISRAWITPAVSVGIGLLLNCGSNPPKQMQEVREYGSNSWARGSPWQRKWHHSVNFCSEIPKTGGTCAIANDKAQAKSWHNY